MFHGVVFDGLDSVFASSFIHTLYCILKALNNRKHIYAITLKNDFTTIKQQQAMLQAEKGDFFSASVSEILCTSSKCLFTGAKGLCCFFTDVKGFVW